MGKSGSKLKKKRSQSIAWSFRFPSLSSLSRRKMPLQSRPHMEIRQWINVLDLPQYSHIFEKFDGVEDLLTFSEEDIKDLGVKNSAHRARIVTSLFALKAKYERDCRKKDKSQRHSVAVETNRLARNGSSDILVIPEAKQSKSLCNLTMEAVSEGVDAAQLRKLLEWELGLEARDLRSHAWYHGAIPRPRAEEVVTQDGAFLVRDCTSQPGNYVLTCRAKGQPLHFVINKVVIQPDTVYERVQYQFEDDAYDTVADLITYYVGSGKCISSASGARISAPVNRLFPLSFYASKYGLQQQASPLSPSPQPPPAVAATGTMGRHNPYNSYKSPVHSPPRAKRDTPPRLPSKKQRSQSLTPAELNGQPADEKSSSADGVIQPETPASRFSTHSLPRPASGRLPPPSASATLPSGKSYKMVRVTSDPALSPCMERRRFGFLEEPPQTDAAPEQPPPKPSRLPSLARTDSKESQSSDVKETVIENGAPPAPFQRVASYHASGSDSGNGSGDSVQSSATGDTTDSAPVPHRGVIIKNPRYQPRHPTKVLEYDSATEDSFVMQLPDPEPPSAFDLESYQTLLLPSLENKPLDGTALTGVRCMLAEAGPRVLAAHLTRLDLALTVDPWRCDLGLGVSCGLELLCLPHGAQLRRDLIERTECLKLLVAVTILTCPTESERAESLNKWIQVAIETKTALGNLFGFCGVMMGLCMPQIQRLASTWHVVRQKFTDSAFNFEAKLRPTLKSMNECTNPQAPNTTIPHLLPFILLQERTFEDILGVGSNSANNMTSSCLGAWENSSSDFGLGTVLAHLESARKFGESLPAFRRNAQIALGEAKVDDLLLDMFHTEFQLKFLWGSRGATVASQERHAKFEQVLNVMADNCEPLSPIPSGV